MPTPTDFVTLRGRVLAFDLDGPEPPALPFAAKLAREHGWTRRYADRVVGEYKRFAMLAVVAGRPVCPSEDVDAAWHLHLTYTRNYWQRFCAETLGRPLHHDPTRGGKTEDDKHHAMYAGTLTVYREWFGAAPPADIWPPADVRFGDDLRHRVVNTARNWVVPKRAVQRLAGAAAVAGLAVVFATGCVGGLNPFELKGVDFLGFLLPMMLSAAIVGRVLRSALRSPGPHPGDDSVSLDWQEAAFLSGGPPRLATAALTRLYDRKALKVTDDGKRVVAHGPTPTDLTPVEKEVMGRTPFERDGGDLRRLTEVVGQVYADDARRLEADGLALSLGRDTGIGCVALVPLLVVVLGFGVPRLVMGVTNDKPVGFLVLSLVIGGFVGMGLAAGGRRRTTRRGDALLDRLRTAHTGLKDGKAWDGSANAALAVALFGTATLAGSQLSALGTWYPRQTTAGSSGCGSGCGTSSGGGGDGGGGGCGGCGGGCGGGGGD